MNEICQEFVKLLPAKRNPILTNRSITNCILWLYVTSEVMSLLGNFLIQLMLRKMLINLFETTVCHIFPIGSI